MKFFADTAEIAEIRALAATGLLDGVTTNPSLIHKSGRDFVDVVKEIASVVEGPVSAEVVALDHAMDAKDERHMKLCGQSQLGALWKKAGLADVQEKAVVIDTAFASFDDYWGPFLAGVGPGGAYVASLSEDRRKALEARLRKRLPGEGARALKARAWCVRGVVPAT